MPNPPDQPSSYTANIACPEDIELAILQMTSHYFYNRDAVTAGNASFMPGGVKDVVDSLRDFGFAPITNV
jgi:hypothetical protein